MSVGYDRLLAVLDKVTNITLSKSSFMTIYGKDFEVSDRNLHGDNSYSFSELSSKRSVCSEGIKMFVLDGLIAVNRTEGGFLYKLTVAGRKYIGTLESDYKDQYLAIAETVHKKYARKSDSAILKEISGKAVQSLRRSRWDTFRRIRYAHSAMANCLFGTRNHTSILHRLNLTE